MRSSALAAVLIGVSLVAAPATAQPAGGVVPVARATEGTEVALSGTQLLMGRSARRGVRLLSAPAVGGAARTLFSMAAPGRPRLLAMNDLDASPERVVFSLVAFNPATEGIVGSSVWAGPPAGPFAPLVRRRGGAWIPVYVQASGTDVAVTEIRPIGDVARHSVFPLGGGPVTLHIPPKIQHVELAGSLVAFVEGERRLVVRDWASGVERARHVAGAEVAGFDVSADGRVLLHVPAKDSLELLDASGAVTRMGTGGIAAADDVRLAGGHALLRLGGYFDADSHVAVIDLATRQRRRLSPPSLDLGAEDPLLSTDGNLAAWTANGCAFTAPVTAPASRIVPPGPCPRAEIHFEDDQPERLKGRAARVRLRCVTAPGPGCRGTIRLKLERPLGKARYLIPAGRRETVRIRLTDRGLEALEREYRLPPPGRSAFASVRITLAGGLGPRSVTPHQGIRLRPARP
jgi:hypothetical protein